MKRNKFVTNTLAVVFGLFVLSACEDNFVDLEPRDELPASLALNNIGGLEATMLQVYQGVGSIHQSPEVSYYKQAGTDLVKAGTNLVDVGAGGMRGMHNYDAGLSAVSGDIDGIFNSYYTNLVRCYLVIQGASIIEPENDAEREDLSRFAGEAHAMIAYIYLELSRRFDNVPLARLLPDGEEPSLDAPLAEKSIVYDTILVNAQKGVELLPIRANTPGVGAPSKGFANLVLAEAYMDLENWEQAAIAAEAVISDASYQLQSLDYIFGLEGGKAGEENNNEIIFSLTFDPSNQDRVHMIPQMFVPLYDRINGVARTMETGGRAWSRFSPNDYYWSLFQNGDGSWNFEDGRLEAWHKLNWVYDDEPNLPAGKELGDIVTQEDLIDQFGEGAIQLRYVEPTTTKFWEDGTYGRVVGDAGGWRNVIVYRYAHAFVIGAEAHYRSGNTPRALELYNRLRERAFGDTEHNISSINDQVVLDEHARELGHEGHRWYMLKRLNLLIPRVSQFNPEAAPNISDIHMRWPLPQSFVDLARVQQNPGY